jgi:hypothetical protein
MHSIEECNHQLSKIEFQIQSLKRLKPCPQVNMHINNLMEKKRILVHNLERYTPIQSNRLESLLNFIDMRKKDVEIFINKKREAFDQKGADKKEAAEEAEVPAAEVPAAAVPPEVLDSIAANKQGIADITKKVETNEEAASANNNTVYNLKKHIANNKLLNVSKDISGIIGQELGKTMYIMSGKTNYKNTYFEDVDITKEADKDVLINIDKVLRDLHYYDIKKYTELSNDFP